MYTQLVKNLLTISMSTILFFNLSYSQPFLAEEEGKTIIEKYSSKFSWR